MINPLNFPYWDRKTIEADKKIKYYSNKQLKKELNLWKKKRKYRWKKCIEAANKYKRKYNL